MEKNSWSHFFSDLKQKLIIFGVVVLLFGFLPWLIWFISSSEGWFARVCECVISFILFSIFYFMAAVVKDSREGANVGIPIFLYCLGLLVLIFVTRNWQ